MTAIVLWDIDQTLIRTGGAGSAAMDLAFAEIYGIDDAFGRVEFSGRTDYAIFRDALYFNEVSLDGFENQMERFRDVYLVHLAEVLPEKEGTVLPGVLELIDAVENGGHVQGIATGNFEGGARLKLEHFGLRSRLRFGAYGDRTAVRSELVREAAEAVRQGYGLGDGNVVVIGDTPLDVEAARANGFVCLAVATGHHSVAELKEAGAHEAVSDLSETTAALDLISA
jgi:phosphoglycolate phosphatase